MLRLIRLTTKLNQREPVKAWPMPGHEASPTPEIPVSLFQEFAISCVLDHLYIRPYSTPFQNSRSPITNRTISFSIPLPESNLEENDCRDTRIRSKGERFRKRRRERIGWSGVKANFHEAGRKRAQADAQSGRKSYKAYLTTDPLIFNFRPARSSRVWRISQRLPPPPCLDGDSATKTFPTASLSYSLLQGGRKISPSS